jgi:hypothetical protein
MSDPIKPLKKKNPSKPISLSEDNWMDYVNVYEKGKVLDISKIKDEKLRKGILRDVDYVNAKQKEAFLDSTNYFNYATDYNNIFAKHESSLVNIFDHDPKASKYTPFNDTPTVDNEEAFRYQNNLSSRENYIRDTLMESRWFNEKDYYPSKDVDYKLLHTDLPFKSRTSGSLSNVLNIVTGKYSPTKPTKPTPYTVINSSTNPSVLPSAAPQRPSYQQIPTKTPTITPIQQSIDDELKTSFIEPAITYPKDVQRFTAGNYLESQGKSSGYVNYGEGEGRKELYENGGIVNNDQIQGKTIDAFYSPKKVKSMGSNRSYPYRTLENPSYDDININPPQYHDPNVIREMRIERRLTPSNVPNDSSFNQINNNDIGFLFNESFGIQ